MQQILIGTHNPSKAKEFGYWFEKMGISFRTLEGFTVSDPEEIGSTFEENAKLKARYYFEYTNLPTIADDGGLEIDALGGLPGVKSRRWIHGDKESTDEELVAYTLERLSTVPDEKRTARLRTVIAHFAGGGFVLGTGAIEGVIAREPSTYAPGFPYRGLLFIPQFGKMYDALSEEEHDLVNHRRLALEQLKEVLFKNFHNGGVA